MNQGLALTLFPEWSPELPSPIRAANKLLRRRPLWLRIERAVDGAADEFLQDKPEKMVVLYGGQGAMGYFRKLATTTPRNRPVRRDMLVA